MRNRLLAACGFALAVALLAVLVMAGTRRSEVHAQVTASRGSVDLAARIDTLVKTFCERSCEQNYQSCVIHQGQQAINDRLNGLRGIGKARAPLKQELPGCWPFECADDQPTGRSTTARTPSCTAGRDTCLAKCR